MNNHVAKLIGSESFEFGRTLDNGSGILAYSRIFFSMVHKQVVISTTPNSHNDLLARSEYLQMALCFGDICVQQKHFKKYQSELT